MGPDSLLIVCYHHVGTPPPGAPHQRTWVSPAHLERHLRLIASCGYRFSTVSEALGQGGRRACITFDDGFADVLDAAPLLRSFSAPATFYVVTEEIGRSDRPWDGGGTASFATEAQLLDLRAEGWEIGSHADVHQRLAGQAPELQRERLARSRERLARLLGAPPASLAFPYAKYDASTLAAAREVGFSSAVRLAGGLNGPSTDRFQLNRVSLCGHRVWEHLERLKLYSTHRGWYPWRAVPPLAP